MRACACAQGHTPSASVLFCSIKLLRLVIHRQVHPATCMTVRPDDGESPDSVSDDEPQGCQTVTCSNCGDEFEPCNVGTFLRFPPAAFRGDRLPGHAIMVGMSVREINNGSVRYAPGDTTGCFVGTAIQGYHHQP